MTKILLILLLFFTSAFSSNLLIKNDNTTYKNFEINYYQDKTKNLSLENIKNIKESQKTKNSVALGKQEGNIWFHLSIKNKTKSTQERILFITEPNLWDIELFIVENNKTISSQIIGQSTFRKDGKIASFHPELKINLDPNKKIDIYIKSASPFHHTFKIELITSKDLVKYKILKNSLLSLYFGAIGALLLYNLFIYLSIRDKNYLLYIGFVFFYLLAQIQHNTPFNSFFSSVNITFFIATTHIFWVAFHTLFSIKLLNIKEHYPKLGKYLLYIGYFLLVLGFYGIYNLEVAIQIVHPFMIVLPFILLFTAILLHIKKNRLAIFYIIAQTLFLTSSLIFGLLFAGVLDYNNFTRYIHFAGSFSEIILFSFALAYKTRLILKDNQKQKELVDEYSKLSFLGQTVINIYHQWKSPVNNIYNSINHIEVAKEFEDKNLNNIIDENLEKIKQNTEYLKETSTNYLSYYKGIDQEKTKFNLKDEIATILNLHKQEFEKINIKNNLACENIEVFNQKNILTNIMIILIENIINISKLREIKKPRFSIIAKQNKSSITIKITDNLGGVKEKNINDIFEKSHSVSSSTGLGLYLAKEFLVPKLNGKISVKNTDEGSQFTLILKHS